MKIGSTGKKYLALGCANIRTSSNKHDPKKKFETLFFKANFRAP